MEEKITEKKNRGSGRPPKWKSAEELQMKIDAYFQHCDDKNEPETITGLAVWLDTTRRTLLDYEEKDEFSHTVKKAKQRCEAFAEKQLYRKQGQVAGAIFSLKNNWGWKDRQDHKVKSNLKIILVDRFE